MNLRVLPQWPCTHWTRQNKRSSWVVYELKYLHLFGNNLQCMQIMHGKRIKHYMHRLASYWHIFGLEGDRNRVDVVKEILSATILLPRRGVGRREEKNLLGSIAARGGFRQDGREKRRKIWNWRQRLWSWRQKTSRRSSTCQRQGGRHLIIRGNRFQPVNWNIIQLGTNLQFEIFIFPVHNFVWSLIQLRERQRRSILTNKYKLRV